ncbi:thermonuclease family protein [Planktotalea sp.]|uniref:thermonuclease family protein n=1 Tax=Planktotalea sp. TaxID=2029877 RepID=UPI003D6B8617
METLVVLLILLFVAVLIFISNRSPKDPSRRANLQQQKPPVRNRYISSPKPFEHKSAAPVSKNTEVVGAAFVVDGDTIVIKKTQIRLFGIDAPELEHP